MKLFVTRSVKGCNVTCMVVDTVTSEVSNETVHLARTFKNPKALERVVRSKVEHDNIKFVDIVDVENVVALYGISEEAFLKNAELLDPTTRKPV